MYIYNILTKRKTKKMFKGVNVYSFDLFKSLAFFRITFKFRFLIILDRMMIRKSKNNSKENNNWNYFIICIFTDNRWYSCSYGCDNWN